MVSIWTSSASLSLESSAAVKALARLSYSGVDQPALFVPRQLFAGVPMVALVNLSRANHGGVSELLLVFSAGKIAVISSAAGPLRSAAGMRLRRASMPARLR